MKVFFEVFNLPEPVHYLGVDNVSSAQFTAEAILYLNDLSRNDPPDFVLSYGDVNSTLAAAIAVTKNRIPFVHVEGGVRGNSLYNPEEINRKVADVLAEVNYCCTRTDVENLERENFDSSRLESFN
jgi:UDP-N-acetylglucosamine 2-epimerase